MMDTLHLLRPLWLLALIPLALLVWLMWGRRAGAGNWQTLIDSQLLPYVLQRKAGAASRWPALLMAVIGLLAIVALAGPAWRQLPQPVFRTQSALVIALDLSRSMHAADIAPSRIERARHKIIDILEQRREGQTALIVYAAQAFVVTPLTEDAATIKALTGSLDPAMMPAQGSRVDTALTMAAELLAQAGAPGGDVLVISDGVGSAQYADALGVLRASGHRVSALGVGTADGAPIPLSEGGFLNARSGDIVISKLDEAGLRDLARLGAGSYRSLAIDDSDLERVLDRNASGKLHAEGARMDLPTDRWREEGPWLLLLALPLAALCFRRGWLVLAWVVVLTPVPDNASALDFTNLWSRSDQKAMSALDAGEAETAAGMFRDPQWRAAAQYRAGNFEQSIESLQGIESAGALYNKGNALARTGRFDEAIEAYEQTLALAPDDEDARHNLDLLRELQRRQEQEQENRQNQGNGQQQQSPTQGEQQSGDDDAGDDAAERQPENGGDAAQQDATSSGRDTEEQTAAEQSGAEPAQTENGKQNEESRAPPAHSESSGENNKTDEGEILAETDLSEEFENEQASEQWLRRIPDDPGGLLRRKFRYQYQRMQTGGAEDEQW